LALGWILNPIHASEHRRFAGPAWPHDHDDLAAHHVDIDAI
jgi:hypothetical protein